MADWNKNNRACTTTWSTLRVLAQHEEVFSRSGSLAMKQLTFWNPTVTAQMKDLQVQTLARQMDNVFRKIRKAKYESGVDTDRAIGDMTTVMINGDKTVSELASIIDDDYAFWGEEVDE
jgi:hypothetical protein